MTRFTTIIIAINRLIVITFFVYISYISDFEKAPPVMLFSVATAFIIFLIFATILRLCLGLPEEYHASKIALKYIEAIYDPEIFSFAKNSYRTFFYSVSWCRKWSKSGHAVLFP